MSDRVSRFSISPAFADHYNRSGGTSATYPVKAGYFKTLPKGGTSQRERQNSETKEGRVEGVGLTLLVLSMVSDLRAQWRQCTLGLLCIRASNCTLDADSNLLFHLQQLQLFRPLSVPPFPSLIALGAVATPASFISK